MSEAPTRRGGSSEDGEGLPLVFDLMSVPLVPLSLAFVFRGWRAEAVGYLIEKSQDLADIILPASLHEDLRPAVFIAAV